MAGNMIIAGNYVELAEMFNKLKHDDESMMVEKAYDWAKQQTWEKMTQDYYELWGLK